MFRVFGKHLLQQVLDHLLFVVAGRRIHPAVAIFQLIALVDQQRHIAAIVHHQLRPLAALLGQSLVRAPPVFFQRLALPGEHRHSSRRNRRSRMVLRGENVATRPANFRAQAHQRLDQHRRLNRHVQRARHTHSGQRLPCRVLVPDRHQARHLLLGDGDLLAAPVGQRHVGHFVLQIGHFQRRTCHANSPYIVLS